MKPLLIFCLKTFVEVVTPFKQSVQAGSTVRNMGRLRSIVERKSGL